MGPYSWNWRKVVDLIDSVAKWKTGNHTVHFLVWEEVVCASQIGKGMVLKIGQIGYWSRKQDMSILFMMDLCGSFAAVITSLLQQ